MENEKMERTKNVPYLGGMIKFRPAGSYVDENTKEEKSGGFWPSLNGILTLHL